MCLMDSRQATNLSAQIWVQRWYPAFLALAAYVFIQASSSVALGHKNNNEYGLSVLPTKL